MLYLYTDGLVPLYAGVVVASACVEMVERRARDPNNKERREAFWDGRLLLILFLLLVVVMKVPAAETWSGSIDSVVI